MQKKCFLFLLAGVLHIAASCVAMRYMSVKWNYNEMDKVINPTVVEPVVQFMYNIKIKYTLVKG